MPRSEKRYASMNPGSAVPSTPPMSKRLKSRNLPVASTGRNDMSFARVTTKAAGLFSCVNPSRPGMKRWPSAEVASVITERPFFPITSTVAAPTGAPVWMDCTNTS